MDELNVIFRNTHENYYYGEGLCYVLQDIFPDKIIRFRSVSDLSHEDAVSAGILILDLCRGEEYLCHRTLFDSHPGLLIGLTEGDIRPDRKGLPLCLQHMLFICKNESPEKVREKIVQALASAMGNSENMTGACRVSESCLHRSLSAQQKKVLDAVWQGLPVSQIARKFSLNQKMVYAHKRSVFLLFNLRVRSSLDLWLLRRQMEKISLSEVAAQKPCLFDAN